MDLCQLLLITPTLYLADQASKREKQKLAQYSDREKTTAGVIDELDRSTAALKTSIQNNTLYSAEITKKLLAPLELYERNRDQNPKRNKATQKREHYEEGREDASSIGSFDITNPEAFSIDVDDELSPALVAEYLSTDFTLVVRSDIDQESRLDTSISYHEIVHAYQDYRLKSRVASGDSQAMRTYMSLREKTADSDERLIISNEEEAYIMQMYVLNILSQGRLEQEARSGTLTADSYMDLFHVQPSERSMLDFFLAVADAMYDSSTTIDTVSPIFRQYMVDHHRRAGRVPYDITPSGDIRIIP
ncbi:hypothetical protein A3D08_03610 [Candidatus Roizmanbacteria bacterium RIFCSPHIGHO2_02_FULL_43_11]|uniref:Uncharacterized protein n=1 Tax=Candidatus Roizmanbacteria bacterium RIFCSPHIGHO2_02_FULL_43_11 TaxID=1802043 RepID=A0A1F7HGX1_9BACT|nr:MAG: hypothetical protein A3D08_03610 [Candidatus Roizmanbacteria bacterium RIFCSPHIGHO2_02_FULL_43_11]